MRPTRTERSDSVQPDDRTIFVDVDDPLMHAFAQFAAEVQAAEAAAEAEQQPRFAHRGQR